MLEIAKNVEKKILILFWCLAWASKLSSQLTHYLTNYGGFVVWALWNSLYVVSIYLFFGTNWITVCRISSFFFCTKFLILIFKRLLWFSAVSVLSWQSMFLYTLCSEKQFFVKHFFIFLIDHYKTLFWIITYNFMYTPYGRFEILFMTIFYTNLEFLAEIWWEEVTE